MMEWLSDFFLIASLPLLFWRLLKGPTWADRILAADLFGIYLAAALLLLRSETRWSWDRDVIWLFFAVGLIGFLAVGLLKEEENG